MDCLSFATLIHGQIAHPTHPFAHPYYTLLLPFFLSFLLHLHTLKDISFRLTITITRTHAFTLYHQYLHSYGIEEECWNVVIMIP